MKMSIPSTSDILGEIIAAVEKLKTITPSLSDEQSEVVQNFVTAQYWAGYAFGYRDAKRGNPNIVEMLAARTPQEQEKKYYPPLEVLKREGEKK
jgi:hypothetical protein